ncbi:DNA primase [Candidatus Woesearchaeota archaeon]|nr:DNA primase [Candidatus Woesearchaeota archaeon]
MLFQASSLKERKEFYSKEFNLKKSLSFFENKPKYFAVDFGTETKIIKDKKMDNKLFYFGAKDLKKRLVNYLPEDVYYDRNIHKGKKFCMFCLKTKNYFKCKNFLGQELVFDVDADNIKCICKRLCERCIKKSIDNAFEIAGRLKFNKIKVVYSGKGSHVHVFDKKAYKLNVNERKKLAKKFSRYGIDKWVTEGRIRLVRLPYSLNGVVSRIVTPIEKKEKFKFKNTLPKFLK